MDMADDRKATPPWVPRTALLLAYPGFTALDLFGPQWFLANMAGMVPLVVAHTRAPVSGDAGATVVPAHSFADAPKECDILFVPGGTYGTIDAMNDLALLAFLRKRAARARIVASTCTGSLVLGAAGLLRGRRATSHWLVRDAVLPRLGASPMAARVVEDGADLITSAGVTAGLDLGIAFVRRLAGEEYSQQARLLAEYPATAPAAKVPDVDTPQATEAVQAMFHPLLALACHAADRAAAAFGSPPPAVQAPSTGPGDATL